MTPLPQQLEDKKKEHKEMTTKFLGLKQKQSELKYNSQKYLDCVNDIRYLTEDMRILTAEIAILEQAIAEIKNIRNTAKVRILRFCEIAQTKDTNYYMNKAEALQEFFVITDEELDEIKNMQSQNSKLELGSKEHQLKVATDGLHIDKPQQEKIGESYAKSSEMGSLRESVSLANSPVVSNLLQKQRQEEIEFLQWIYSNNGVEEDFDNVMILIDNRINRLKEQQLNQPKTEK